MLMQENKIIRELVEESVKQERMSNSMNKSNVCITKKKNKIAVTQVLILNLTYWMQVVMWVV